MNNKLKNEMEKIKMPKDTKERIIAACENAQKRTTGTEEYTDHVYNAEQVNSRKRIIHSISAVAACAVIVGGIAGAGILFNKRGGDSQLTQVPTEATTEEVTTEDAEPTTEMPSIPEEMLVLCETSPFTDILSKDYKASPFASDYEDISQEQRDMTAELFNSQTWYEIKNANEVKYHWTFVPEKYYFVTEYNDGNTITKLSVFYDDYVCVNSYALNGDETGDNSYFKIYTCNDVDFGEKLAELYGKEVPEIILNDDGTDLFESINAERDSKSINEKVIDFINTNDNILFVYDNGEGAEKQDINSEQIDKLKKYFEEHELTDVVDNTFGSLESDEWNEVFGTSQIQLYDWEIGDLTIIYVSKDNQYIAVLRPPCGLSINDDEYVTVYRAEDLEELDFIHDFGI